MDAKAIYIKRKGVKRCPKCGKVKVLLDFGFSEARKDFCGYCRECLRSGKISPQLRRVNRRKAAIDLKLITPGNPCASCRGPGANLAVIREFTPQLIALWYCSQCADKFPGAVAYVPPEPDQDTDTKQRRTPEQIREQQREAVRRYRARKKWGDW